ncbi:MAG: hypothetical protein QXS37_03405 [Candidatus Aenigmatarchaeota archaeon]
MKDSCENFNIPECIQAFAKELFRRFYSNIRRDYILFQKTVPFVFVWEFFSFYKIGKKDAKKILKIWANLGLITLVKFHGVRLREGVEQEIISDLANEDTNFWLATAPHGLRFEKEEDCNAEKKEG